MIRGGQRGCEAQPAGVDTGALPVKADQANRHHELLIEPKLWFSEVVGLSPNHEYDAAILAAEADDRRIDAQLFEHIDAPNPALVGLLGKSEFGQEVGRATAGSDGACTRRKRVALATAVEHHVCILASAQLESPGPGANRLPDLAPRSVLLVRSAHHQARHFQPEPGRNRAIHERFGRQHVRVRRRGGHQEARERYHPDHLVARHECLATIPLRVGKPRTFFGASRPDAPGTNATGRRAWSRVGGQLLVMALMSAAASSAQAQGIEGARLIGFGQAQRALTNGNDSLYINPAGLAIAQQYTIESAYLDDFRGSDRRFNSSVIDSQAGSLAGGVAYTYTTRRPDDVDDDAFRLEGHRIDLGLATLLADSAALGVTVRYMSLNLLEDGNDVGGFSRFNLDAGFQYRITPQFSFGLVGYNLIRTDRPETPISMGGGLGYQTDLFTLEGDAVYNFQAEDLTVSGGLGVVIADSFPIRAGLQWNQEANEWRLSGGIGFLYEQAAIDLGYRQSLNSKRTGKDKDDRIFAVSIRVVFL